VLHDSVIDDSNLDINAVTCKEGDGCADNDAKYQWGTSVKSSCDDWDYQIYTTAFDTLNNGGTYVGTGKTLKVDNSAPSVPIISASLASTCQGTSPLLDWGDSSESRSGLANYDVQVDNTNSLFPSPECIGNPALSQYSSCTLNRGYLFYLRARSSDKVGNPSAWSTVSTFNVGESDCDGRVKGSSCGTGYSCSSSWLNLSKQCSSSCTCAYTISLPCDAIRECTPSTTCGGVAYTCRFSNLGVYEWVSGSLGTETACTDNHDNDCDNKKDIYDYECKYDDGHFCTLALECKSGYCDNDGQGANSGFYNDDSWCFTNISDVLENQDFNCEISTGHGNAVCDEFRNGTDCSYLDGRHFICNKVCALENRDTSSADCLATGVNCVKAYTWIKAGETGVPILDNKWEYTLNDMTTQECCGDDSNETVNKRNTSCITNCAPNDFPTFGDLASDKVCCNSPKDCVYSGICFTSYPEGGSPQPFGGDSPESIFCENAIWYDCDTSESGCEDSCGKHWLLRGEPSVGEYDSGVKYECCEDDLAENRVNSSRYTGHLPTDARCCSSSDDCVLNGVCGLGEDNGGSETNCYDGIDNDCDGATDFCDERYNIGCQYGYDNLDADCESIISGNVKGIDGLPLNRVRVIILTNFKYKSFSHAINFTTVTNANGDFSIHVYGNSTYNIVAQKPGYYMIANLTKKLNLGQDWQFLVVMARDMECRHDCTKTFDGLCHAECDGINGCSFYDYISKAACDLNPKHAMVDYEGAIVESIECCTGSPKAKAAVQLPLVNVEGATTVQRITRPVLFRGKLSQMIIVTYN